MTTNAEVNVDCETVDRQQRSNQEHALQVICLGSGGGPDENNVTGFLVRSVASGWSKGSLLAVDAGSHLAAITRILERSFPLYSAQDKKDGKHESTILKNGPFAGLKFNNQSARANALQLLHTYISCYLITHPHLDHLSGFAINTAALSGRSRPKTLAALPATVEAVKRHIFNDVIWPNLSDEEGGVGFVTFQRLKEGGDPMLGVGQGRGYIDVCDGIGVKAFCISHGRCTQSSPGPPRSGSASNAADLAFSLRSSLTAEPMSFSGSKYMAMHEHSSLPGTPGGPLGRRNSMFTPVQQHHAPQRVSCVVDSTAYFLRDEETGREILMFGDVEPDTISSMPRNEQVWMDAVPKVINGSLRAVFIECSYSDAVADETLFGHLCPRHLVAELSVLADAVHAAKAETTEASGKKRKRSSIATGGSPHHSEAGSMKRSRSRASRSEADFPRPEVGRTHIPGYDADGLALSPRALAAKNVSAVPQHVLPNLQHYRSATHFSSRPTWTEPPLKGLTVVVIHVKDTFQDGPPITETILAQLEQHEKDLIEQGNELGCKFVISACGESYFF